jgi:hypothetical protein
MTEEVRRAECRFLEGSYHCKITGGTCCTPAEFVHCIIYQNKEEKRDKNTFLKKN